jgi:uncharacterized membrane protein YeaQ/YmgE (transglycosylase-associated protein family)
LSDIKLKAVIVGAIVDNVGTIAVMLFLMTALASQGISQDEVVARMKSPSGLLLNLIIGLGCTCLGAYVAGRMAQRSEVLHGAVVAVAGMVLALLYRESGVPLWYDIMGFAGMLPAGMLGGHIARQRRTSGEIVNGKD